MRIAVVGATGRIGTQLTKILLRSGHKVKALSREVQLMTPWPKSEKSQFLGALIQAPEMESDNGLRMAS